jgi:ABC-type lipoprotein release transport system permease subunit
VRVALGAAPREIVSLVIGGAVRLMILGLVPGLIAALVAERWVRTFLFEARPHDPGVYTVVAVALLVAGTAAAIAPARRATRVDPLIALRD